MTYATNSWSHIGLLNLMNKSAPTSINY